MGTALGSHRARSALQPQPPTVLTVLAEAERRMEVHALCVRALPRIRLIDVATVTDAVLTLLSERIDLVLVDVLGAGDMLPVLQRHVRRSAPDATVLLFGPTVLGWQALEPLLRERFAAAP